MGKQLRKFEDNLERNEDAHRRRLERLEWISNKIGATGAWQTFPVGELAGKLLAETRRCFVDGQFLAAVVLGSSFVERVIVAHLISAGRSDVGHVHMSVLIDKALNRKWISENEHIVLDHARHLRDLIDQGTTSIDEEKAEDLPITDNDLELEARAILVMAYRLLSRNAL